MPAIKLGQKVQDTVTGFKGTAVARYEYISGCTRISVQPPVDKDGKVPDAIAFDEPMLVVLDETPVENPTPNRGGPRPEAQRPEAPARD